MAKIRNRVAFFKNPKKSVDGLTSKERRRLKRAPLHEQWRRYEEKRENRRTTAPSDTRRVVINNREEQNSSTAKQTEEETLFDVHVDPVEYNSFWYEERRQALILEIRTLEKQVREKKDREKREEERKKNTKKSSS